MDETYSIVIKRDSLKFHAKHAIIIHAGEGLVREKWHEHTFHFAIAITGPLNHNGWVADFTKVIHCCMELIAELENKMLIPGQNPDMKIGEENGKFFAQFQDKCDFFPLHTVKVLPYDNVTTEWIAHWFLHNLVETLEKKNILAYPNNRYRFKITLEEEEGCFVEYSFKNDD